MNSKNKILTGMLMIALLSLFINPSAIAQSGKCGIKGGLNVSNLYLNNVTDQNARLGINLGVFGQLYSTPTFAIQTELLYSTKGTQANYGSPINTEIKFNLNYLDLPVLAVIKLGQAAEIHLGGYASYLLKTNVSYSGGLGTGTDKIDKDNLKSYDYGLVGGLGMNFGKVQVGARYNYGLVKIAQSSYAKSVLGDAKNSCAQLYIAFSVR